MAQAHEELSSLPAARVARRKPGREVWRVPFSEHLSLVAFCLFLIFSEVMVISFSLDRIKGFSLSHIYSAIGLLRPYWKRLGTEAASG